MHRCVEVCTYTLPSDTDLFLTHLYSHMYVYTHVHTYMLVDPNTCICTWPATKLCMSFVCSASLLSTESVKGHSVVLPTCVLPALHLHACFTLLYRVHQRKRERERDACVWTRSNAKNQDLDETACVQLRVDESFMPFVMHLPCRIQ